MEGLRQIVLDNEEAVIGLRRDLHLISETAYTEKKTAAYVETHCRTALEILKRPV